MKRLIINADDLGLSEGANLGILRAHQTGIVTSATVMMNMPGAVAALSLARQHPSLGVGIHLTLTGGRPLSPDVPSLTDADGSFLKNASSPKRDELECELRAQVEAFLASGLTPTHLDSHHHVHLQIPAVAAIVLGLAEELKVPVRGLGGPARFIGSFYGTGNITPDALVAIMDGLEEGETGEIMCHPAYLDPELLAGSRYALERVHELTTLIDPAVRKAAAVRGIQLVSYRDL
ncbi:MAG TPA: carbohydrate deacetylase [Symbiobacteriaceae bacterium]|nr:carbohydrate deacetylase [Symbiobacteriaceae bacterium]